MYPITPYMVISLSWGPFWGPLHKAAPLIPPYIPFKGLCRVPHSPILYEEPGGLDSRDVWGRCEPQPLALNPTAHPKPQTLNPEP